MPTSRDMAIFCAHDNNDDDDDMNDYFTPCACARGNMPDYPYRITIQVKGVIA